MPEPALLQDRVAIVAGVGPELGRAIAHGLVREGAHIVLAETAAERLGDLASELRTQGGRVLESVLDGRRAEDCRRLVDQTLESFGRIDVLVGNGEVTEPGGREFAGADLADWSQAFEADLFGALRLAREVIPPMRAAGKGSIVMLGALETRLSPERAGPLPIARGALLMAAQVLARELGPDGIRVNTVVPGFTEGPRLRALLDERAARQGTSPEELRNRLVAEHALGRLTDPGEVADAIVFFASDLSRIVTGQSLDVNCGHYFH